MVEYCCRVHGNHTKPTLCEHLTIVIKLCANCILAPNDLLVYRHFTLVTPEPFRSVHAAVW
jgi:hypothetical protein